MTATEHYGAPSAGRRAPAFNPAELARLLGQPEPTAEQAAVISAPLGPAVVVAGAGSGKSETMAGRVVWLVANGLVRPEHVLGLTFTRKAAAELAERVRRRLDQLRATEQVPEEVLDGDPTVSTYNSYAARLVGDHALREAIEPTTRLLSQGQSYQLASRIVADYDGPMDAITVGPRTVTDRVLELAGELADHLRTPDDVRGVGAWIADRVAALPKVGADTRRLVAAQRRREQLLPLVERYIAAKRDREVMDYGDQVALAARIALRHPEVGMIERSRYGVVLLDEYQDTSHAQLLLLRALFGGGHPVTAVGDPCQSIYGWRGASAGNLTSFPTDFPESPGRPAPVRKLATSFRNGERVLAVARRIAEPLREESDYVPVLYPSAARRGRGAVAAGLFTTETEEAHWIAQTLAAALDQPGHLAPDGAPWPPGEGGDGPGGAITPGDIAVLCRKRSQFPLLREALEERGIPVEVVGLGGLMTVPEVRDIVATLRVLHDPTAGNELARLLTGPRWRLGPRDLVALGERAAELAKETRRDLASSAPEPEPEPGDEDLLRRTVLDLTAESGSLVDALDDPGGAERYSATGYERLAALGAEMRALRRLAAQPLPDLVGEVERMLGLDIEVGARPGRDPVAARADLDAFLDAAVRFVGNSEDPTLGAFLNYLRSAEDAEKGLEPGERVGGSDTVKLMTVHAAKGLQWPVVVVPGLAGGTGSPVFPTRARDAGAWVRQEQRLPFPLRGDAAGLPRLVDVDKDSIKEFEAADRERHLMEERRLAYVAVTRASYALVCTGHWWGHASASLRGPSQFLEEVREACAAGAGRVVRWAGPPEEGEENPQTATVAPVAWPQAPEDYDDAAARRYREIAEGARLVELARAPAEDGAGGGAGEAASADSADGGGGADGGHDPRSAERAGQAAPVETVGERWLALLDRAAMPASLRRRLDGWDRDTTLLLAHRDLPSADGDGAVRVELPAHLSVSSLVSLARDPALLARQIRRPLPRPPAPHTRRGTAFHTWLEQRFGQETLLVPDELPGAADDGAGADDDLAELQRRFEAGEWGGRVPLDVEIPFETVIGDRLVRGRMDAVFHDPRTGRYDVVDWKTGRPPATERERRAVAVQLAAYRIAWADLAGVPLEQVRAAFHYVRADETVRPADLLDAEGLAALLADLPVVE
ncbi:UvrD-helicase domain-containing protein [Streptomonospora nanhaiensis]|uniref:DNA 3'-5' helicase n=1 Tax=Streptomonospora nanhaiensis TaxID=1323731 RepID=A0A853BTS8_9ACTN|nr:ATP-dependent DNA helicase [Streptomonospora nanhaiensis]MBV2362734.1 ATP-dependent helicase [Streptomonospora nanhaiensis]MBX9390694.1 ATP-dependent helicase [Streptomonospora nanhaiensis]NYI97917.1 DNA helicase-2/ATP-dependent DNA helicase PcrA [Streptomonospora nanhaiensis]